MKMLRCMLAPKPTILYQPIRFATKKAGGTVRNGRDSAGKRLGLKKFGGEVVAPGNIIIRQRGQKYHSGANTKLGRDHTIYATMEGYVKFLWDNSIKRNIVTVQKENPNPPPLSGPYVKKTRVLTEGIIRS